MHSHRCLACVHSLDLELVLILAITEKTELDEEGFCLKDLRGYVDHLPNVCFSSCFLSFVIDIFNLFPSPTSIPIGRIFSFF